MGWFTRDIKTMDDLFFHTLQDIAGEATDEGGDGGFEMSASGHRAKFSYWRVQAARRGNTLPCVKIRLKARTCRLLAP